MTGAAGAARAAFEAVVARSLPAFEPVSRFPGFAQALASTIDELRSFEIRADRVAAAGAHDAAVL